MTKQTASQQMSDDYKLLLTPPFAAMTKITDNLFLTGVGGMTRANFAKNHIDFVVNITVDAPFWQDTESMRIALEDDHHANLLPHLDYAVDKIHEMITKRNSHVLVHCVAGVSRSATIVLGYLMKYKRLDLRSAFNFCYNLRPVIRPNNGFMTQLIIMNSNYSIVASAVRMIEVDVDGTLVSVPNFFLEEHPQLVLLEVLRVRDAIRVQARKPTLAPAPPPPSTNQTQAEQQTQQQTQQPHQESAQQQQQQAQQQQQQQQLATSSNLTSKEPEPPPITPRRRRKSKNAPAPATGAKAEPTPLSRVKSVAAPSQISAVKSVRDPKAKSPTGKQ